MPSSGSDERSALEKRWSLAFSAIAIFGVLFILNAEQESASIETKVEPVYRHHITRPGRVSEFKNVKIKGGSLPVATSDNKDGSVILPSGVNPQVPILGVEKSNKDNVEPPTVEKKKTVRSEDKPADQPTTIDSLWTSFQEARTRFLDQLKVDYGAENFGGMFMTQVDNQTVTLGRTFMVSPSGEGGPSRDRLKRKLMRKILKALIDGTTVPFVWSTGGHSAAAGHGNLFNQSYTAVMERNARDMFAAIGLDFVGRNYAMGGTPSGMELASCTKEVFGLDMDILSWDFGMTDGYRSDRMELYFYRAGLAPSRPACIALQIAFNKGLNQRYKEDMSSLEDRGLTVFYKDESKLKAMNDVIPDTLGKTQAEIDAMPTFIRSYKCGNSEREKGDPTCDAEKWTDTKDKACEKRKYRTGWHPGWKWHALHGNLNVLFLMELIEDALKEIQTKSMDYPSFLLDLQRQEDAEYQVFIQSEIPPYSKDVLNDPSQQDLDRSIIYKAPNFCHTARLPAETRHFGILTESDQKGFYDYDKGTELQIARKTQNPDGIMRLVYDGTMRQNCVYNLQMDYKDYFFVHGRHQGWSSLVLPNAAELKTYGSGAPTKGFIAFCWLMCDWGACPKESVNEKEFNAGKASIEVNRIAVKNVTVFGPETNCYFLMAESGHTWQANENGQYEIRARVHDPTMEMRFSSFMIW